MNGQNLWTDLEDVFEYHGMCVRRGKWNGKPGIGLCYKDGYIYRAPILLQKPFADIIEATIALLQVAQDKN